MACLANGTKMGKANRRFTPPDHSVLPSLRGIRARPQRAQLPKLLGPPSAQQGQGADQLWQIIGLKLVVASLCTQLLMGMQQPSWLRTCTCAVNGMSWGSSIRI